MIALRWIAFVVIAVGLQVPNDLSFRVCLCKGMLAVGLSYEHECKSASRPAPSESCCSEREEEEPPADRTQCDFGDRCGCVLVHVPHRPDTSKVTAPALRFDLAVGTALVGFAFIDAIRCTSPLASRSREHDPPSSHANLPLRI